MSVANDKTARPWKLRGYTKGDKAEDRKLRAQSTCRGDRALDDAMKRLEADSAIGRITVEQGW